ncbi:hypothetical protein [Paracoccus cavernae]
MPHSGGRTLYDDEGVFTAEAWQCAINQLAALDHDLSGLVADNPLW